MPLSWKYSHYGWVFVGMFLSCLLLLNWWLPVYANSTTGPSGGQTATTQLLTTTSTPNPSLAHGLEKSMWEELLITFAIRRDPELSKVIRLQQNVNTYVYMNVLALGGVNAGQSIPFLAAPNQTLMARRVLGVIGSSMTLVGTGIQGWMSHRLNQRSEKRIYELKRRVHAVVNRLRRGDEPELVRLDLDQLCGPEAAEEFLELWRAVYIMPEAEPGSGIILPPRRIPPVSMPMDVDDL